MTIYYSTVATVVTQLGWVDADGNRPTLDTNTVPTLLEVADYIESAEEEIENRCKTAWRAKTVTNELHTMPVLRSSRYMVHSLPVQLRNRFINTFVSGTDKIEIWNGDTWTDLVATGTEGTGPGEGDFYVMYEHGVLFLNMNYYSYYLEAGIRVTYRFGQAAIPRPIKRAATLLASAMIMEGGMGWVNNLRQGERGMSDAELAVAWEKRADQLISRFKEVMPIAQH